MSENIDMILRGRKMKKLIERKFVGIRKKYDLRQIEIEVLLYLNKYPNANSSDIYRQLLINKGHVSQSMDNLCKKGFVTSVQDVNDRRYVTFIITPLGNTVIEESIELRKSMMQQLFVGISAEEIEMMRTISAKLCDNIDRIE